MLNRFVEHNDMISREDRFNYLFLFQNVTRINRLPVFA